MKRILLLAFVFINIVSLAHATQLRKIWVSDQVTGTSAEVETNGELASSIRDTTTGTNAAVETNGELATTIRDISSGANAAVETISDRNHDIDGLNGVVSASAGYGRVDDDTVKPIRIDAATEASMVVSYAHHEIHEGSTYRCFSNKDMANGGTYNIAFTTPDTTTWIHFTFTVEHELEAEFKLYEDVTSWVGGTPLTPVNAQRNSVATSGIVDMVFDATVTLGTPITLVDEVGGSGKKFGGSSDHDLEWILKQNTTYYLLLTNQGAGTSESNFKLDWYGHASRN